VGGEGRKGWSGEGVQRGGEEVEGRRVERAIKGNKLGLQYISPFVVY